MKKRAIVGLVSAILLVFAMQARADVIAVGNLHIGSWGQDWQLTETGAPFDHVQMFLLGGGPTWTVTETSPTWGVTSANGTMAILDRTGFDAGRYGIYNFNTAGLGNAADAYFLTQKWNGTVLMREYYINRVGGTDYSDAPGGGWYIKVLTPGAGSGQTFRATVPDGGVTAVLLGIGMFGLGLVRRMVK